MHSVRRRKPAGHIASGRQRASKTIIPKYRAAHEETVNGKSLLQSREGKKCRFKRAKSEKFWPRLCVLLKPSSPKSNETSPTNKVICTQNDSPCTGEIYHIQTLTPKLAAGRDASSAPVRAARTLQDGFFSLILPTQGAM